MENGARPCPARVEIERNQADKEGVEKWKGRFEKKLGVDLYKDVLPIFGSEIGWYLDDVDIQGVFPYPRVALFIKINGCVNSLWFGWISRCR